MTLGNHIYWNNGLNLSEVLKARLYGQYKRGRVQLSMWVSRLHRPPDIMEQHLINLNYLKL